MLNTVLEPWHWFSLAGILIILEMLVPGVFLMWIGLGAAFTGCVLLLVTTSVPIQIIFFAISSVVFVFAGKKIFVGMQNGSDRRLNQRAAHMVGQIITLSEDIVDSGRVKIGDTYWKARATNLKKGTRAKIVGIEGNTFNLEEVK